ncbi:hypothetical protein MKHDV_01206 [Halodesulfovibrio sp. MK-HDV]|nr:hypothetical protein MKHDV_01206 [Halodesulfovibrio sp. MK-HDV]
MEFSIKVLIIVCCRRQEGVKGMSVKFHLQALQEVDCKGILTPRFGVIGKN